MTKKIIIDYYYLYCTVRSRIYFQKFPLLIFIFVSDTFQSILDVVKSLRDCINKKAVYTR